ncbi:hypothetical protein HB912_02985 [Listeria aquatica]|uniref:Uncharacterized protein n=1 Tax=Listeria aquatica TaxID=1494960 RepID=A0A841ZNP5_9LIST|nr:hypothetical protein [Listeria aquatica]MBC1520610.1 hypothetical protein [Listeria aquatica]
MEIWIIGSVASGKTTLAKELQKELGIPYYELDVFVHGTSEKVLSALKTSSGNKLKKWIWQETGLWKGLTGNLTTIYLP